MIIWKDGSYAEKEMQSCCGNLFDIDGIVFCINKNANDLFCRRAEEYLA